MLLKIPLTKKRRIINKNVLNNESTDQLAVHVLVYKWHILLFVLKYCRIIKTLSQLRRHMRRCRRRRKQSYYLNFITKQVNKIKLCSWLICRFVVLYMFDNSSSFFSKTVFLATICWISEKEEIYNSDRDRFSDCSLYDQRIWLKLVAFKWDSLVVSGRPPPLCIRDKSL